MLDYSAYLTELKERGLLPEHRHCVYVSGSLVRGWGNKSSDLDFYVITDTPWESSTMAVEAVGVVPNTISVEVTKVDQLRLDVEYWTADQMAQVLRKVHADVLSGTGPAGDLISPMEIRMLEKLVRAVPVEGVEWLDEVNRQLADSALWTILASRALHIADIFLEDAAGQVAGGDLESAVLAARFAFGRTVDALLATHGEIVGGQGKWRAKSFQAAAPPEMSFDEYWRWETMHGLDLEDPAPWVTGVLRRCQQLAREMKL